jgi:predicted ATPase
VTQLRTLGGLRLEPKAFTQPKPLVLLSYLSLEGRRQRKPLAELFWQEGNSMKSLSMTLTRLRQGVGDVVEVNETWVAANLFCDARELLGALDKSQWQLATDLYQGAFLDGVLLEDWSNELEEWVYTTREYLAERVQYALLTLAEQAAALQDFVRVRELAERAYKLPGLSGTELNNLKRLYPMLCAGRSLLAPEVRKEMEDYGLALSLSTEEARATFKPKGAPSLPVRATSFVGRDEELTELATLLSKPNVSLLTLLGPGGVGKTRLALQLAHEESKLKTFKDGIYFIELETLSDPSLLPSSLLSQLGLGQQSKSDPLEQLTAFVADKNLLLVLDNVEQLKEAAGMLSRLLSQCPNLKLLATSRERLGLEEEFVFTLEGLAYPKFVGRSLEQPGSLQTWSEEANLSEAVHLFRERAQQVQRQFDTAHVLEDVIRICQLVEGLPLALELAASWVRVMSCRDIAREIEFGLEFLSSARSNVPERHRSLKAALEYSWKLLTAKEQEVLGQLAIFVGGFRREAASEVAGATIPVLASLVDKSLLRVLPDGRYDKHPLVHQFSREKLAQPTHDQARAKHGNYYLAFLEKIGQQMREGEQQEALDKLGEEQFNAFAAWDWASEKGLFEKMQQSRRALTILFDERGRYQEGEAFFAKVLQSDLLASGKQLAAYLLGDRAWFVYSLGDFSKATKLAEESLALMRSLGDDAGLTKALNVLACIMMDSGQLDTAQEYLQEMLAAAKRLEDPYPMTIALLSLGGLLVESREFSKAEHYYGEAIHLCRQTQDAMSLAGALNDLAVVLRKTDRLQEALRLLEESLNISQAMELRTSHLYALAELAEVYLQLGGLQKALEYAQASLDLSQQIHNKRQQTSAYELLGRLYARLHKPEEAIKYFRQSLELARDIQDSSRALHALVGLAELVTLEGKWVNALQILLNHPATTQEDKARVSLLLVEGQGATTFSGLYDKNLTGILDELLTLSSVGLGVPKSTNESC